MSANNTASQKGFLMEDNAPNTEAKESDVPEGFRRINQFQLMSESDIEIGKRLMMRASSLRRDQIAVNSWGFPTIPIPEPRTLTSGEIVQTIPVNTHARFFGHPIFWIDPSLTEFNRSKESEESWSIRMFYLIMGFGFWDENIRWIDYLRAYNMELSDHEVDLYRNGSVAGAAWAEVPFLDVQDLKIPLSKVQDAYDISLSACQRNLESEAKVFRQKQIEAVRNAKSFVGEDPWAIDASPENENGFWARIIWPTIGKWVEEYESRLEADRNASLFDLSTETERAFTQFQDILAQMDRITATLSIVVIRNCETNPQSYTQMLSFLGLSMSQADYRSKKYIFDSKVSRAFSEERAPGAMDAIAEEAFEKYASAWRRMRLALCNNYRISNEEPVIPSYPLLEVELVEIQREERAKRMRLADERLKNSGVMGDDD